MKRLDFPRLSAPRLSGAAAVPQAGVALTFTGALFSPDRRLALVSGIERNYRRPYARLVSTEDNGPLGRPLDECDSRVAFSRSGRSVALATWDGPPGTRLIVRVYDARSGKPRSRQFEMDEFIHTLEFSPDERHLAVGQLSGVVLCDLESGRQVTLEQRGAVDRVHFSRDGRRLAVCGSSGWAGFSKPGICIWDLTTFKPVGGLVAMSDTPLLFPAEQGDGFVTIDERGAMQRWDFAVAGPVQDLGKLAAWPGISYRTASWTLDAEQGRLAMGSNAGTIYSWDLRTGQPLGPAGELHQPAGLVAFAPDGRWLAVSGDDGTVALFDPRTGRRAGPLLTHGIGLLTIAFTPESSQLLTVTVDGHCHRWELGAAPPLTAAQWQTWLEAATGLHLDGENLKALSIAEYEQRVQAAHDLQVPLAAPTPPPTQWHADEALRAEHAGQLNSARFHLNRWIALAAKAWLPLARRARIYALEGDAKGAVADLTRAAALASDEVRNWQRHQTMSGKLMGRRLAALE